jgi:hypothetical protein
VMVACESLMAFGHKDHVALGGCWSRTTARGVGRKSIHNSVVAKVDRATAGCRCWRGVVWLAKLEVGETSAG